jgi:tetratricopeptide (TPR) repeat protein
MPNQQLTCFLIAPFGEKSHQLGGGTVGQFELIRASIKEIIESFPDTPIKLMRADEIADVGLVQETFIGAILKTDIVIADLSATGNANVFYELGLRFALRKRITIPIWQKGTELPADLKGTLGVVYEPSNPVANRESFHKFIRQRLASTISDSPVYRIFPVLNIIDKSETDRLNKEIEDLKIRLKNTILDQLSKTLWNEAENLLLQNNLPGAFEKFNQAYEHTPENLEILIRYGRVLSMANRHDESIAKLLAAVKLIETTGVQSPIVYRELGMAYSRAGKIQLALDWLQKAITMSPLDSDIHGIIGGVYKQNYEIEKAIEAYERGFNIDPRSTYCVLNIITLRLIRNQTGDRIRVRQLLTITDNLTKEISKAENTDHWAIFDRAYYLLYSGNIESAVEEFEHALKKTKIIGEIESARKNLDLFVQVESNIQGLQQILEMFEEYTKVKRTDLGAV